jgi:hypothetical protein
MVAYLKKTFALKGEKSETFVQVTFGDGTLSMYD